MSIQLTFYSHCWKQALCDRDRSPKTVPSLIAHPLYFFLLLHKRYREKIDEYGRKRSPSCSSFLSQAPGVGSLERRILEVNRKRVKVVKPGSKTSFPATEIRGSYAPPFHVSLAQYYSMNFLLL